MNETFDNMILLHINWQTTFESRLETNTAHKYTENWSVTSVFTSLRHYEADAICLYRKPVTICHDS